MLDQIKENNDVFYGTYHKDHLKKLDTFDKDVREYKELLIKESPIKGGMEEEINTAKNLIDKFEEGLKDIHVREQKMQFGFELFNINYIPIPEIK